MEQLRGEACPGVLAEEEISWLRQGPRGVLPISRGLGQATGWWEESVEKRVSLNSDMSRSVPSSVSSSMGTGVFHPSPCLCQQNMSSSYRQQRRKKNQRGNSDLVCNHIKLGKYVSYPITQSGKGCYMKDEVVDGKMVQGESVSGSHSRENWPVFSALHGLHVRKGDPSFSHRESLHLHHLLLQSSPSGSLSHCRLWSGGRAWSHEGFNDPKLTHLSQAGEVLILVLL